MMTPCSLDVDYDANNIQEYITSHVIFCTIGLIRCIFSIHVAMLYGHSSWLSISVTNTVSLMPFSWSPQNKMRKSFV